MLFFVGLELISIPTYVMLYLGRGHQPAQEAATKYFFLSILSSALLLYGFSFLYGAGRLDAAWPRFISALAAAGADAPATGRACPAGAGADLRRARLPHHAVPFHFYAPDVYQGTTHPNAGLLAVVPKIAGLVALVRIVVVAMPGAGAARAGSLSLALAMVTMTLGNLLALWQEQRAPAVGLLVDRPCRLHADRPGGRLRGRRRGQRGRQFRRRRRDVVLSAGLRRGHGRRVCRADLSERRRRGRSTASTSWPGLGQQLSRTAAAHGDLHVQPHRPAAAGRLLGQVHAVHRRPGGRCHERRRQQPVALVRGLAMVGVRQRRHLGRPTTCASWRVMYFRPALDRARGARRHRRRLGHGASVRCLVLGIGCYPGPLVERSKLASQAARLTDAAAGRSPRLRRPLVPRQSPAGTQLPPSNAALRRRPLLASRDRPRPLVAGICRSLELHSPWRDYAEGILCARLSERAAPQSLHVSYREPLPPIWPSCWTTAACRSMCSTRTGGSCIATRPARNGSASTPDELIGRRCIYHAPGEPTVRTRPPPACALRRRYFRASRNRPGQRHVGPTAARLIAAATFCRLGDGQDDSAAVHGHARRSHDCRRTRNSPTRRRDLRLHDEVRRFRRQMGGPFRPETLIGNSPAIVRVRAQIELAAAPSQRARSSGPAARARSTWPRRFTTRQRRNGTLVPLACAVLETNLLRSTLAGSGAAQCRRRSSRAARCCWTTSTVCPPKSKPDLAELLRGGTLRMRVIAHGVRPLAEAWLSRHVFARAGLPVEHDHDRAAAAGRADRGFAATGAGLCGRRSTPHGDEATSAASRPRPSIGWPPMPGPATSTNWRPWFANRTSGPAAARSASSDLPEQIHLAADAAAHPPRVDETIVLEEFLARVETRIDRRAPCAAPRATRARPPSCWA